MHSIRVKITAITIAAIVTTILSIFAASSFTIQVDTDRRSVEMMNLIARDTGNLLEQYFSSVEQSVEMVANIAGDTLDGVLLVESGIAGSGGGKSERTAEQTAGLDAYLAEYCVGVRQAFESVASHTNGVVSYYYCILPEISRTQQGFFYSKVGKTGFYAQKPLDASKLDQNDKEHNAWFFTPIERGRPSWVGPYRDEYLNDTLMYSYIVPIFKAGTLVGVLGMDIPFDTLTEQVSSIRVYKTGFACLFDSDMHLLYHPELPSGSVPKVSGISVDDEVLQKADNGDELIRYEVNGVQRQLSYVRLSNGMKLVITAPVREINASRTRLIRIVLLVMVAIIIFFAVLLLFVMGVITSPLQRLTAASKHLASADYDVELKQYESRDEVGELTKAFITMKEQMKSYIDDLNHRIYTDTLTDVPNMRHFFKLAEAERTRLLSQRQQPAMLYFNLIGMKHFNQQYGFAEGDKLIREVADILVRHYGINCLCRFSEDHFAVVTDEESLEEKLQSVFADVMNANGGNSLPVRVGIYPNRLETVNVSIACDRAKYACDQYKGYYVSGYCFFDETMLKRLENIRYIISHLDQALEEHWIQVYYQPIIRAVNGKVCDEEALSRWIDPEKGFLSPADFIPILENARLIYKLDFYVLDQILEKMKRLQEAGLRVVPHSLNLSRVDFDAYDVVEEIRRRVDAAGVPHDRLTIEITESIIGSDFDFMKSQVERFQALGFEVWMDDFGSGYSSLDMLQDIHFDLLKLDMRFMHRFDEADENKIILTELVRMATALNMDTVCEGVETAKQVEFLRESGCTKLQGYYFCKPVPFEEIIRRNREGTAIGFEDPRESEYLGIVGRINLYDLAVVADENAEVFRNINMLPIGILEVRDDEMHYIRTNKAYRDFMRKTFGFEIFESRDFTPAPFGSASLFMKQVRHCCQTQGQVFFDEELPDGSIIHSFVKWVGVNPVTGKTAVVTAVLSITAPNEGTTYASIARALAADYSSIYYVDLNTEQFIEYSSISGSDELVIERRGENFFAASQHDAFEWIYEEDRKMFIEAFTKENIQRKLNEQGFFAIVYRLMENGEPVYVSMKVMRMLAGGHHIIIGVSNVNAQMRQQAENDRIRNERDALARVVALSQDYLSLYTVYPETGRYIEFSASDEYQSLGIAKEGEDFFGESAENGKKSVAPEDLPMYLQRFTKENVLAEIRKNGVFRMIYHLIINGETRRVCLKAALVKESDGEKLMVGLKIL